jgi:hypothetical protein
VTWEAKELDPLLWAKRLESQTALNFLRKGCAEGDSRLQEIVRQHIDDGICTDDGKLLRRWDGLQWVSV